MFTGELNRNVQFNQKKLVLRSACDDPERCTIDCLGREVDPLDPEARRGFVFEYRDTVTIRGITIYDGLAWDRAT